MKFFSGDRIFFLLLLGIVFAGLAIFSSAALGLLARKLVRCRRIFYFKQDSDSGSGFSHYLPLPTPLSWLKRSAPYVFVATLLFTALVFVPGIGFHSGGATRWINLHFTTVQPSEFLKIGFVLALAWWLAPRRDNSTNPKKGLFPFIGFFAGAEYSSARTTEYFNDVSYYYYRRDDVFCRRSSVARFRHFGTHRHRCARHHVF